MHVQKRTLKNSKVYIYDTSYSFPTQTSLYTVRLRRERERDRAKGLLARSVKLLMLAIIIQRERAIPE